MEWALTEGGYWLGTDIGGATFREGPTPDISRDEALRRVQAGLTNGPLFQYCSSFNSHHCPGDLRTKRLKPEKGWAFGSYSKSEGMYGYGGSDPSWEWPGVKPYKKSAQITQPSMSMVFIEEADGEGENLGTWVMNVEPPSWEDPFAVFHGRSSTFGFADGHAEDHKWTDPRLIRTATESAQGLWRHSFVGGNASNPDFRWVWDRFQHGAWKPLK